MQTFHAPISHFTHRTPAWYRVLEGTNHEDLHYTVFSIPLPVPPPQTQIQCSTLWVQNTLTLCLNVQHDTTHLYSYMKHVVFHFVCFNILMIKWQETQFLKPAVCSLFSPKILTPQRYDTIELNHGNTLKRQNRSQSISEWQSMNIQWRWNMLLAVVGRHSTQHLTGSDKPHAIPGGTWHWTPVWHAKLPRAQDLIHSQQWLLTLQWCVIWQHMLW